MKGYIGPVAQQVASNATTIPLMTALLMAQDVLKVSPVPDYPGFTIEEVRVLAAYRCQHRIGTEDIIWQHIVSGLPEAWLYAVHEAAEIEAFVAFGIDFLQRQIWEPFLPKAHVMACIAEDSFLKAWADHLGYNTTEMALEIANPIRRQHLSYWANVDAVQMVSGWAEPSESQELQAQAFYKWILR
jgi:hypothetical protein